VILSTPDAIGKALEQHMSECNKSQAKRKQTFGMPETDDSSDEARGAHFNMVEPGNGVPSKTMTTCPECGLTISHEGGCLLCHNCGYSKC
jgi:ribonucleoside-diphosphate reductase alpha chain